MPSVRSHYRLLLLIIGVIVLVAVTVIWWVREDQVELEMSPPVLEQTSAAELIGRSVDGRPIEAYSYGEGTKHLVFVGGIHGGYEWNSTLLAYEMMELFEEDPSVIPADLKVTIIPALNPDGLYDVIQKEGPISWADVPVAAGATGTGRMNRNGVDLNRNFDCKWQATSTWRQQEVSAGTAPFSEPEAAALRDFILNQQPVAVVFWHSQANAVYASECEDGVLPATRGVMHAYASAAGYGAVESFDHYPVTGDAEGWLASIGIPAITVELSTHETTDWQRNMAGMKALLEYFRSTP